jgi:hypothetical protein
MQVPATSGSDDDWFGCVEKPSIHAGLRTLPNCANRFCNDFATISVEKSFFRQKE